MKDEDGRDRNQARAERWRTDARTFAAAFIVGRYTEFGWREVVGAAVAMADELELEHDKRFSR